MMEEIENANIRLHARLNGRVQGVGFRAFVEQVAISMGLSGWVRNRWDGSVEVVAEGQPQDLEIFLEALRRGPRSAFVSELSVDWQASTGEFTGFFVRRTD